MLRRTLVNVERSAILYIQAMLPTPLSVATTARDVHAPHVHGFGNRLGARPDAAIGTRRETSLWQAVHA